MLPVFNLLGFEVYTYPLMMGLIWGVSYHFCLYLVEFKKAEIKYFKTFFFGTLVASWIGAKAFYLLSLNMEMVKLASTSSNFWLGGGFVFYGGLIGGLVWGVGFAKMTRLSLAEFEFAIPALCLGHALGRVGCLLAGCCYGSLTKSPLSIFLHNHWRHPVQLYEAVALVILFIFTFNQLRASKKVILKYLVSYGVIRFLLEFLRGDKIRGENVVSIFSTSQIIALAFLIIALSKLFWDSRRA